MGTFFPIFLWFTLECLKINFWNLKISTRPKGEGGKRGKKSSLLLPLYLDGKQQQKPDIQKIHASKYKYNYLKTIYGIL